MLGVLLLLLLQAVEVWRRFRSPGALSSSQFWRRMLTAALLELVLLMWTVGEPLMRRQPPLTQLAYWTAALLFGIAAAFSALREMGEVTRQYHRQRIELFRGSGAAGDADRSGAAPGGRGGDGATGRRGDGATG
jgi:hypothetical protein